MAENRGRGVQEGSEGNLSWLLSAAGWLTLFLYEHNLVLCLPWKQGRSSATHACHDGECHSSGSKIILITRAIKRHSSRTLTCAWHGCEDGAIAVLCIACYSVHFECTCQHLEKENHRQKQLYFWMWICHRRCMRLEQMSPRGPSRDPGHSERRNASKLWTEMDAKLTNKSVDCILCTYRTKGKTNKQSTSIAKRGNIIIQTTKTQTLFSTVLFNPLHIDTTPEVRVNWGLE